MNEEWFIPTTREIEIAPNIVYRPVRSWHSNTYAGEQLETRSGDRSGCMRLIDSRKMCNIPLTVTHRLYWHKKNPADSISAFLSFPNGMGSLNEYFWEVWGTKRDGDTERFTGENAERDMEKKIIRVLNKIVERMAKAKKMRS